jgi:hypothetical protein
VVKEKLPGFGGKTISVAADKGPCLEPVRYGFRSFDRQWIIPDNRLINRPNATLWEIYSEQQVYLTAFTEESPTDGPALTVTGYIPDLHHYKGSFGGRVFPLWRDSHATVTNIRPKLLSFLSQNYGVPVNGEDVLAYVVGISAHASFTDRFQNDLTTPALHIPFTANGETFFEAAEVGRKIIWLHTFGERMINAKKGRPSGPPRLPPEKRPRVPEQGTIPTASSLMPDSISYDLDKKRLYVGKGFIDNVDSAVWNFRVSGKQVLGQWFSYRKRNRERPIMGDRRPPSALGEIQPDCWQAEYTTELLNVINVLGLLTELQPIQTKLMENICADKTISVSEMRAAGVFDAMVKLPSKRKSRMQGGLYT